METGHLPAIVNPGSATKPEKRAGSQVPRGPGRLPVYAAADEARVIVNGAEGFRTARGRPFSSKLLWMLRDGWSLPTVNPADFNPPRWGDGSYSVEDVARAVGATMGGVYHWLKVGRTHSRHLGKGTSWKIALTDDEIAALKDHVKIARRSKKGAS